MLRLLEFLWHNRSLFDLPNWVFFFSSRKIFSPSLLRWIGSSSSLHVSIWQIPLLQKQRVSYLSSCSLPRCHRTFLLGTERCSCSHCVDFFTVLRETESESVQYTVTLGLNRRKFHISKLSKISMSKRSRETWEKKQTLQERRSTRSKITIIRKYVTQNAKEVTDDFDKANEMMDSLNTVFKSDGKRHYFF